MIYTRVSSCGGGQGMRSPVDALEEKRHVGLCRNRLSLIGKEDVGA